MMTSNRPPLINVLQATQAQSQRIDELQADKQKLIEALEKSICSMQGYRREYNDNHPCDAERNAIELLAEMKKGE